MNAQTIIIKIGALSLGFTVRDAALARRIRARYDGWTCNAGRPAVLFRCTFVRKPGLSGGADPAVAAAGRGKRTVRRNDFECCWTNKSGDARLRRSIYSFDALLRVLAGTLLPLRGTLVLHASAVAANGRGYVFAGRSGSGKTTIAILLKRRTVLNDEICAIAPGRASRVSGTPFWGEMATGPAHSNPYPLAAIYFLAKTPQTERVRLTAGEALKRLLACVCFFSRSSPDFRPVLKAAAALVERVPCYELRFRRDPAALEATVISKKDGP